MFPMLNSGNDGAFQPFMQGYIQGMEPITMYVGEPNAKDGVPVLTWEQPYTLERIERTKMWRENGYIHPDSYLETFNSDDYTNTGNFLVSTNYVLKGGQVKARELMGQSGNADLELYEVQTGPSINVTTHAGGSMLGIPITSENPVKAMQYINEMHQNTELLNMMMWGIEGIHYDLDSRGMVIPRDVNGWSDSHGGPWTLGNQFKQLLNYKEDPQKYQQMIDLTAEAWPHESLGFRFNRDDFDAEYAAISSVNRTYSRSIRCGVNTDQFEQFQSELKAAGVDRVFEAAKIQYAAWKAEKYGV
jgi:putative aldouronate transport system substrate-binding protein